METTNHDDSSRHSQRRSGAVRRRSGIGDLPQCQCRREISRNHQTTLAQTAGQPLHTGGHAQRQYAALEDGRRREGVPPHRRAGEARVRARHGGRTAGATTARRRARPSRPWRATACASYVTNRLPEHTTVHWHGIFLPNGMDGVGGLNQPHIQPGETYVYEFTLRQHGTFMYHPHADEMVQLALGMMGLFIVHPREAARSRGSTATTHHAAQLRRASPARPRPDPSVDDRVQHVDLQQPGVPGHRSAGGATRRARAHPRRQPVDARAPDPHPRHRVRGHRHRRRAGFRRPRGYRETTDARAGRQRRASSSSSPMRPATGRSTATSRTTR